MAEKTAQQLQQEKDDELRRQQMAMSWFDRLTGGMGFFEMIFIGLLVFGLWFAAKANPEFVEGLIKKLPDTWQDMVTGGLNMLGIPVDLTSTLANMPIEEFREKLGDIGIDKDTAKQLFSSQREQKAFVKMIADANGGKIPGKETLTNDKTVHALLDKRPDVISAIAKSNLLKGDKDGKVGDAGKQVLASLCTIINDGRMDTLLKGSNSATLYVVLGQFNADLPKVIQADIAKNGSMSKDLRDLLTAALTPDGNNILPNKDALTPKIAEYLNKQKAVRNTVMDDDSDVKAIKANNKGAAYTALVTAAGSEEAAKDLLVALKSSTGAGRLKLALKEAPSLLAYANSADLNDKTLPKDLREGLTELKAILTNGGGKAYKALVTAKGGDVNTANELLVNLKVTNGLDQLKLALKEAPALLDYANKADLKDPNLPKELREGLAALKEIPPEGVAPALRIANKGVDPRILQDLAKDDKGQTGGAARIMVNLMVNPSAAADLAKVDAADIVALSRSVAKAKNQALPEAFNAQNLPALLKAAKELGDNLPHRTDETEMNTLSPDKRPKAREDNIKHEQTLQAVYWLTDAFATKNYAQLSRFTDDHIVTLLGDKANNEAIYTMLTSLKGLDPSTQKTIDTLTERKNWDLLTKLAADKKVGAPFVKHMLLRIGSAPKCDGPSLKDGYDFYMRGRDGILLKKNIIGENEDQLISISKILTASQCTAPVQVTAAPAAPAAHQRNPMSPTPGRTYVTP